MESLLIPYLFYEESPFFVNHANVLEYRVFMKTPASRENGVVKN